SDRHSRANWHLSTFSWRATRRATFPAQWSPSPEASRSFEARGDPQDEAPMFADAAFAESFRLRAHRVGHQSAALPERARGASRAVARRLVLDLGIELGAEQHDEGGEIDPHEEHDDGAERAIALVVAGEPTDIERKQRRCDDPEDRGSDGAPTHPAPFRLLARWREAVDRGKRHRDQRDQDRPPYQRCDGFARSTERDGAQHGGKHGDESERDQGRENGTRGKAKRRQL